MQLILAIAAGGAVGALARHFLAQQVMHLTGGGFPWGILTANVLGSFLMGLLVEVSALVWQPGAALRAFLAVGFLGAFTTFSTFALDVALLYERGALALAGLYVALSVLLSVGGLFFGLWLVRSLAA
ncbi:protein CrcB [Phormidium willei BDU 130791]|nr:protein CrcB [Phormidium willei BDU 130791]